MQKKKVLKTNKDHISPGIGLLFLALFVAGVGFYLIAYIRESATYESVLATVPVKSIQDKRVTVSVDFIDRFRSQSDFKKYLSDSGSLSVQGSGDSFLSGLSAAGPNAAAAPAQDAPKTNTDSPVPGSPADNAPQDLAYTAQAKNDWFLPGNDSAGSIDRPDIVKSDGNNLFFSPDDQFFFQSGSKYADTSTFSERQKTVGKTDIISIEPPEKIKNLSQVDGHGDIMLAQNIMAEFLANQILGYDVSDPANPAPKWKVRLDDNSQVVDSEIRNGVLFLVIKSDIDFSNPCPLRPILDGDDPLLIRCEDIYHPVAESPVDTTYTVMSLDAQTGSAVRTFSFVGSGASSEIYLSPNYLYATWGVRGDPAGFFSQFIAARGQNLVPDYVGQKITKLVGYDLTYQAKMAQIDFILQSYAQSLSSTQLAAFKSDFAARLSEYALADSRDLDKTEIAKVGLDDFKVIGGGEIPGHPLDRLSLNEYNGNLRVGVAVGDDQEVGLGSSAAITNDIYVLDNDLQVVGSLRDLGLGQQVSAARFWGNAGFLATARDGDPLYVLDMSDPQDPNLAGQMDLGGTSSYLYPLTDTKVLAVSKDNLKTRLSYYDMSLPSEPKLLDKYELDEYWTDVDDNHQAFYLDATNGQFFVPAAKGGYFFGYTEDKLTLKTPVTGVTAVRALGVDNHLFLIGDERIVVVDGSTLEKVSRVDVK